MQKMILKRILLLILSFTALCYSLPLSTSSRWIVNEPTGARVKLTCTNWAGHLEPLLAEGLDKKPVSDIAKHVVQMGFNCVRLTWAIYMFTRHSNLTVARSFGKLGLRESFTGIARNNPGFLKLTVVEAQRAVVEELARQGVMVVLDNHVSQPMWCCGDGDGNGFFGDKYFDAKEWLQGLAIVAKRYKDTPMVVGMSLRNELRGPHQNVSAWYRYIERGAKTIHKANPKLLVIVSGLRYDLSFAFLKEKPLKLNFNHKLVYEVHRYAFTAGQSKTWLNQPFSKTCDKMTQEIRGQAGFLVEGDQNVVAPLFVSEFGVKQVELGRADSLFLDCFLGYLADMDLDWSVWALQGSYYVRNGVHGFDETYGMLNSNWSSVRNPDFVKKLQLIQQQIQDPNSKGSTYHILYHPSSGRCIRADNNSDVHATDCRNFSRWNHGGNGNTIQLMGSNLCLSAAGNGIPTTLSLDCGGEKSRWGFVSNSSRFQLANRDHNGEYVCLEWDPSSKSTRVVTNKCEESPHNQLFKLISANVQ